MQDTGNVFTQGTSNQFLRVTSTNNINLTMAAFWRYNYASGTWGLLIEEYINERNLGTLGAVIDNVRFELDGNAALRSFDLGNIEIHGVIPEPSTYALLVGLGALGLAIRRRHN